MKSNTQTLVLEPVIISPAFALTIFTILLVFASNGYTSFVAPSGNSAAHQACLDTNADVYNDLLQDVDSDYADALKAAQANYMQSTGEAKAEYLREVIDAQIWSITNPARYLKEVAEAAAELSLALEQADLERDSARQSAANIHNQGQSMLYQGWGDGNRACDAEDSASPPAQQQSAGGGDGNNPPPNAPNVPTTILGSGLPQGSTSATPVGSNCTVTDKGRVQCSKPQQT